MFLLQYGRKGEERFLKPQSVTQNFNSLTLPTLIVNFRDRAGEIKPLYLYYSMIIGNYSIINEYILSNVSQYCCGFKYDLSMIVLYCFGLLPKAVSQSPGADTPRADTVMVHLGQMRL